MWASSSWRSWPSWTSNAVDDQVDKRDDEINDGNASVGRVVELEEQDSDAIDNGTM